MSLNFPKVLYGVTPPWVRGRTSRLAARLQIAGGTGPTLG